MSTNPTDNQTPQPVEELDEILDDIFTDHTDNDNGTCESCYYYCTECNKRFYRYSINTRHEHEHPRKFWNLGQCNCSQKEYKAEAKARLLQWGTRQRIDELRRIDEFQQMGTLTKNQAGKPEWVNRRKAELQASLKDGENQLGEKS